MENKKQQIYSALMKCRGINGRIQTIIEYHYDQALREIQAEVADFEKREGLPIFENIIGEFEENWGWDFTNWDTQDEKDESFARQISGLKITETLE